MSAIIHGFFLLISVIIIPTLLNKIPLSVLAAILLIVGYKTGENRLLFQKPCTSWDGKQSIPFTVNRFWVLFLQILLVGIGLGLGVGIIVILIKSFQNSHFLHIEDNSKWEEMRLKMTLAEEVTFFNKGAILKELDSLPRDTYLETGCKKDKILG